MTELQFQPEKQGKTECRLIADLATDQLKRAAFEKLAGMHRLIAEELEKTISLRSAAE